MLAHVENRITYSGNGNATEFAYQFKILDRTDIKVLLTDADGKEKLLTKDYYVDVEKNVVRYPGYAVGAEVPESERPPVLPTGWKLTIYREVPVTQETDLPDQYPFNQVEAIGDKLTMIAQQLTDVTSRSLKISISKSADIDATIPWENGKSFRISDDGKTLELSEDPAKVLPLAQGVYAQAQAQAQSASASAAAAAKSENSAAASAGVAGNSAQYASASAASAAENARIAEGYKQEALTAKNDAATSATNAKASEANAKTSENNAEASKEAAQSAASNANNFATSASSSASEAKSYRDATSIYAANAKNYSENVNVFLPSVSASGVLSWSNKAGLANPASVNIKGEKGDKGTAASIMIGTVTTGAAGSNASVTNSGTASNVVLDFTLPRGEDGADGADGGITVDTALSATSTNPVQNKVIKAALDGKVNKTDKIYEANLEWGGRNISNGYGPIDAAMISELGANRFAFGNAAGITVEYSTDAGKTWLDYGYTDIQKVGIFGVGESTLLGKSTIDTLTTDCMLRISIAPHVFGLYTVLNKFVIHAYASSRTGAYCTIDASIKDTPTVFKTFANKVPLYGEPAWNIINTPNLITYNNAPSTQFGLIRFTFGCTAVNTEFGAVVIDRIMAFGGIGWSTPSNIAKNGHLYTYNNSQEAKFPAAVTAPNFIGKVNGFTLEASVPANAKFIDNEASNVWTALQTFNNLMLNREKYTTYVVNGTSDTPIISTMVYAVTGAFTLNLATLAGLLNASESSVFTAYFAANADYSLTISNAGKLKYVGSASDVAITSAGLLLNVWMSKDADGMVTSIVQASKLEGGA